MANRRKIILALSFFIFFLAGCAEKNVEEDPRLSSPKATYDLWLDASLRGDLPASLDFVTKESKKFVDLQAKNRDVFMQRLIKNAKEFKKFEIVDTKIKKDRAVVLTRGPKGATIAVPFKKDPDGWKVDLLAMFTM